MFGGETAGAPEPAPLPPATTPGREEEDAVSSDEEARADSVYGEDGKKRRTSRIGLRWSGSPTATSAESIRLKRIMLGLVALALCPALAIGISTAAGYIVFNWNEVGIAFAYVIISEVIRRIIWRLLRNLYCRRVLGLTSDEILDINGPRRHLSKAWLSDLLADSRRRRNIKICDVLFRKGGHVVPLISAVLIGDMITDDIGCLLFANTLGCLLITTIMALAIWNFRDPKDRPKWRYLSLFWGATDRIRDGRYAQQNSMLGNISLVWGVTIAYFIARAVLPDEDDSEKLWAFALSVVLLPLTFGDALGEVIGTPFGRHRFKVRGLGEINQKSLEGCVAVFLGSLVPLLIIAGTMADSEVLNGTWALICVTAVLTTLTETLAFRSTDNMVIPLCNAALFVVWWKIGGVLQDPHNGDTPWLIRPRPPPYPPSMAPLPPPPSPPPLAPP